MSAVSSVLAVRKKLNAGQEINSRTYSKRVLKWPVHDLEILILC